MFCVPIPNPRTRQRETSDVSPRNKGGNVHVFGRSRSLHLSAFTSRTTNPASNSPTSCLRFASSPPAVSSALHRLICPWFHTDDLQRRPGVPIYWLLRFLCTSRGPGPYHLCPKTW